MTSLEAGIVTDDPDSLANFYASGLGFSQLSDMEFPQGRVIRMRCGDAGIKLYRPSAATSRPESTPWHAIDGFAYAALRVDDADSTVQRAVAAGASVMTPVTAHRPGARFALIADPQGNVWEILEENGP